MPNKMSTMDTVDTINMHNLPSYNDVMGLKSPEDHIVPQEQSWDNSQDALPSYSCSVFVRSVFHLKREYEFGVHKARDRNWSQCFLELRGTSLRIFKVRVKNQNSFSSRLLQERMKSDMPLWAEQGEFIKAYTLQHADIGVAADYHKRRHVIRLRAETDQFLLSCFELSTFVRWSEALSAAIDVSLPLEDRTYPREYFVARRTARRTISAPEQTRVRVNDNNLINQQQEIMRIQFPHLAADAEDRATPRQLFLRNRAFTEPPNTLLSYLQETQDLPDIPSPVPSPRRSLSQISASSSSSSSIDRTFRQHFPPELESHPSICADSGKWTPPHTWTSHLDLLYAKRTMAVLLRKSSRKSDVIILRGREWKIDWQSGKLRCLGPPEYGEVQGSTWMLGKAGLVVRQP